MANTKTKSNGDVVLANTMPKAEYMYGCMPTSVGMLLGYYDINGYNGKSLSNLISGTVALNSRGTDGNKYDEDAFDTVLGKAIASKGYVERFCGTTPEAELPYTYKGETTELNTDAWDCIADYLGTGQYWRGNTDKSTTETQNNTLNDLYTKNYSSGTQTYGSITRTILWRNIAMLYGLDLYVQSRGYSLDRNKTASYDVDTIGGSFTFEDFKKEIDAGRPVIVSITGHAMVAYGYNAGTREIIFDDCYDADQRMTWGSTYLYSGKERAIQSVTTIVFKVSGGGSTTADTVKPTISVKASTTSPTNKAVKVTATFSDNVAIQSSSYRIGDSGSWTAYPSGGVSVSKNATVYFKAVDTSGNQSTASYKVTNIDTTAPAKPTITVSTKKTTSNPVTVTAKFSSDSTKKEYSTDGKTWKTYTAALTFKSNGTAYFRGTDAAGNVSTIASYTVSNIKGSTPAPSPTPAPGYPDNNDWMYDTKTHKANTSLYFNTLTQSTTELPVDKSGTVNSGGKHSFVGYEDAIDYKIFRLESAAKLNFTITATGASKFKVYALVDTGKKDASGNKICKVKTLRTVSLKKTGTSNYVGYIKDLLLKKNDSSIEYYVSMAPTKASKKKGVYYNVQKDSSSVFFNKGNNTDDSDVLSSMKSLAVTSPGAKLLEDWVGFGDTVDYRKFTLGSAANLSFIFNAGNAAKLTLYKVVTKGSKSSLKSVKSVSVKNGKSNPLSSGLIKSGTYVLSVKSTAPAKSDNSNYSLTLSTNSVFFNHSDSSNSDDQVIVSGYVNSAVGNVGYLDSKAPDVVIASGWVGYGDTIDYKRFSLTKKTDLRFGIRATDPAQFTLYKLVTKKSGKTTKTTLKKLKSKTLKSNGAGNYVATNIQISLDAGTNYYFSVKSTNASKGGNAEYFVFLPSTIFSKAALSMPEASADLDAWNASSAAEDSEQDSLLAGLTNSGSGDALAAANVSASTSLQLEDDGALLSLRGLLA